MKTEWTTRKNRKKWKSHRDDLRNVGAKVGHRYYGRTGRLDKIQDMDEKKKKKKKEEKTS